MPVMEGLSNEATTPARKGWMDGAVGTPSLVGEEGRLSNVASP